MRLQPCLPGGGSTPLTSRLLRCGSGWALVASYSKLIASSRALCFDLSISNRPGCLGMSGFCFKSGWATQREATSSGTHRIGSAAGTRFGRFLESREMIWRNTVMPGKRAKDHRGEFLNAREKPLGV